MCLYTFTGPVYSVVKGKDKQTCWTNPTTKEVRFQAANSLKSQSIGTDLDCRLKAKIPCVITAQLNRTKYISEDI